ncbi:olfactory receptor 6N1-like [Acipenser ruthenus]|uniref:olfactory receptor 6N1-like n=1 Tax=Acipenser ruthenus TaxID=7906 RepID=UPI0027424A96|nr:olfactory receptor 6N1-like [Acipenser ruthenus]
MFQLPDSNRSNFTVREFVIVGGEQSLEEFYTELSVSLLLVYLITLIGNLVIIVLVLIDHRLHTPMYYFLWNLSFVDIMIITTIIPKMLAVCLMKDNVISFEGCFLQMYFFLSFECTECFLLTVMAYDRYIAICKPLHYSTIITERMCVILVAIAWILGLLGPVTSVSLAAQLPFCGPNKLIYWFCDYPPVVQLACTDTTFLIDLALAVAMIVIYIPFLIIVWSYVRIIICIFRIPPGEGRRKAFSTCSSHLIIVLLYFFSSAFVYIVVRIGNVSSDTRTLLAVCYSFATPMANPIIYSLRNKEIRDSFIDKLYSRRILQNDANKSNDTFTAQ